MQFNGVSNTIEIPKYTRLSDNDISRVPALKINKADYYQGSSPVKTSATKQPTKDEGKELRNKIFTVLTFGLVGLYLAHRQNLFNPIKREAKKILKTDDLKNRVLNFVQDTLSPDKYKAATRQYLTDLTQEKGRPTAFVEKAKKILADDKLLEDLDKKVAKVLNDDTDTARFQRGFAVDIMDRLSGKIEKTLKQMKDCGETFKNKGKEIIEGIFAQPNKGESVISRTFLDSINNRSSMTIENFIKDME